jgi:orotate phosphoribosyltransferase
MSLKETIEKFYMHYREEPYTLSSGVKSNYYFNIKALLLDPHDIIRLYREFSYLITKDLMDRKLDVDDYVVAGMELGGALLTQIMVCHGNDGVVIRKKQKDYGMQKRVEGDIMSQNIVIVDDVITSGKTVNEVSDYLRSDGWNILDIYCIIDRSSDGSYKSLYKESDFSTSKWINKNTFNSEIS